MRLHQMIALNKRAVDYRKGRMQKIINKKSNEILDCIRNPILFKFGMDKRSSYVILFNSRR